MKIIAADIILLIMGVLLIGGATAGLVLTPGGLDSITGQSSPSGSFNVTFATGQQNGRTEQVAAFTGGNAEYDITLTNITKVTFVVDCNDPAPDQAPDYQVTVEVQGPNNFTKSQSGPCGDMTIEIPITSEPSDGAVIGSTESEARSNLATDPNATKATGTWRVTWTGQRQGGIPGPISNQLGTPSGSIANRVETWEAELTPTSK